jgi:hypothetical protein
MPVSPGDAIPLTKAISETYTLAQAAIVKVIGKYIKQGIDEPTWAAQALSRLGGLNHDVRTLISHLNSAATPQFKQALTTAYVTGQQAAAKDLGVTFTQRDKQIYPIRNLLLDSARVQSVTGLQIASSAPMVYQQAITQASQIAIGGGATRLGSAAIALADLTDDGIVGFADKAGRQWNLVSYVEMATRTMAARAIVSGHIDQLSDLGQDLVIVSVSPGDCPQCSPWDGTVLSGTGSTVPGEYDGYTVEASLDDATSAGLFHPNCTHDVNVFIPDVTTIPGGGSGAAGSMDKSEEDTGSSDNTETDGNGDTVDGPSPAYAVRQQQRSLERSVRNAKSRVQIISDVAGAGSPEAKAAGVKLRTQQANLRQHVKDNGLFQGKGRTSLKVR